MLVLLNADSADQDFVIAAARVGLDDAVGHRGCGDILSCPLDANRARVPALGVTLLIVRLS